MIDWLNLAAAAIVGAVADSFGRTWLQREPLKIIERRLDATAADNRRCEEKHRETAKQLGRLDERLKQLEARTRAA